MIGSNLLSLVKANVVRPAKVTTELAFKVFRLMLSFVGAWMSWRTMFVHAATAGAMFENSLTTQADPDEVGTTEVDADEVMIAVVVVEVGTAVVDSTLEVVTELDVE